MALEPDQLRGTGFGLYMTKNLLKFLGWKEINVRSEIGKGTTIHFDLPVSENEDNIEIIRPLFLEISEGFP